MTFGSLFAGIGGFDLGFERAGMTCKWQVELNHYCQKVLKKHWPDVALYSDATKFCRRIYDCEPEDEEGYVHCPRCNVEFGECECVGTDQVLDEHGRVDLICGGDPCQENSKARNAGGLTAPSLGGEFIRIVDELRPRFVLRENPPPRLDAPWCWRRFGRALQKLGYAPVAFRVRACCVGADIRRERVFVLAELQESEREGLEGDVSEIVERTCGRRQNAHIAGSNRWSATPRICRATDGIPHRVDRLRGLGNAVVPQVAEWIGRRLMQITSGHCGSDKPGTWE